MLLCAQLAMFRSRTVAQGKEALCLRYPKDEREVGKGFPSWSCCQERAESCQE